MTRRMKNRPVWSCIIICLLCGAVRWIEYFVIRTDETAFSENFLHKIFGIAVLAVVLHVLRDSWKGVGFAKEKAASDILKGFLLGGCCFAVAYGVECLALYRINGNVALSLYVSGFSLNGKAEAQGGVLFLLLCIICNIINVWMEEGVFRGLFMKLLSEKVSFVRAASVIALLFGIWHWVMPLRDYLEGRTSPANLLVMGMGYLLLAGMMSIKWSLLYRMTGTLWMGLGDHLFNNVVVTNLLHVISNNEADSMQIVRIMIGQILSFSVVMLYYRKKRERTIRLSKGSEGF